VGLDETRGRSKMLTARSRVGELAIQSGLLSRSTRQAYIIVARGLRRERTVKAMSVGVVVESFSDACAD
jgi:hypothetical protein